ncbi:Por secretion system C-terminal sorting domain-containing protein [Dyadobacter sp. SG02]|uniref:T9SS type A sorting domain-containing protein n=1 Tax=Dyadobacter sp. SG02 TaxID=1855291 RepID=UPI0008D709AA|nr:T9SS type A sorting domain-containing protein [Dyadobacter sp. SG02]SEI40260.1 Por secretion system C-terminal sorting domain-containing protein [Dyadobacter sp. SG02]
MKKLYPTLFLTCGFLIHTHAFAQSINSGTLTNDGGSVDNHPVWTNSADGNYFGSNNGKFNHFGSSTLTLTNDGGYRAATGHTDVFSGPDGQAGAQEIAGSKRLHLFNADFVNGIASPIYISNTEGISIAGALNFENGITSTLRNLHHAAAIVFEAGATYQNGNTDAQHVNGYVAKIGNTAFSFPIGSGTDIRPLTISAPAAAIAHLAAAWIAGSPALTGDPSDIAATHPLNAVVSPVVSVSDVGQWDWITVVPPGNDITVTVSLPDVHSFAVVSNLRLVGWNGTAWINLSANANATGVVEGSTLTGTIPAGTNISALAIGSTQAPLPVRLVSFDARAVEKSKVLLIWKTASEQDNDYFQVEHSLDARTFEAIGRVKGRGTVLSENSEYSFNHTAPVSFGVHYYRLKQVDFDGNFAYSAIRTVDLGDPVTLVYPNPATDKINIDIADWKLIESVELLNASGQNVYKSRDKKPSIRIDSRFFPAGLYLLRFKYMNGTHLNQKIAIAN